jgi:L-glyceraldehyde 3-phosphate reductase
VRRQPAIASVLIGASKPAQVLEAVKAVQMPLLNEEQIAAVEAVLGTAIE